MKKLDNFISDIENQKSVLAKYYQYAAEYLKSFFVSNETTEVKFDNVDYLITSEKDGSLSLRSISHKFVCTVDLDFIIYHIKTSPEFVSLMKLYC